MTSGQKAGAGHNWSGILIALIGAASTLGGTWLTLQHSAQSAGAVPTAQEVRVDGLPALTAPSTAALPSVVPAADASASDAVTVPALAALPLAQASAQITALGLKLDVQETASTEPAGAIVGVDPAPGSQVRRGTTIKVQVSGGLAATVEAKHAKGKKGR